MKTYQIWPKVKKRILSLVTVAVIIMSSVIALIPAPALACSVIVRPTGAGSLTNCSVSGAGSNWAAVDEEISDGDTTYVYSGSTDTDCYATQNPSHYGTIDSVTFYAKAKETGSGQVSPFVLTHTFTYGGGLQNLTSSYADYSVTFADNPNTGNPWTWSEIDDMQIGVRLDASSGSSRCTQVWASISVTSSPDVSTSAASSVEETTATLNGNITSLEGCTVITRGFEYDIDSGAPYANDWHEDSASYPTGAYSTGLAVLDEGELYYYRAYAENTDSSFGYGAEVTFLTKPDEPNSLAATNTIGGQVDLLWNKGSGADNTYIRRKAGSYPTSVADGTSVYTGAGSSCSDTSLPGGFTYYYRAWSHATEGGLTQYSDSYSETFTYVIARPTLTTQSATAVGETVATLNGTITDAGGENDDFRGFVYDTASHGDPGNVAPGATAYSEDWTEAGAFSTGAFSHDLVGLTIGFTYYARSCSHNSMGWSYGSQISFTCLALQMWLQPITIVTSSTVPDRSGNTNNGVITWGANPTGMAIVIGSLQSSDTAAPTAMTTNETTQDIAPVLGNTSWITTPSLTTNPGYPLVHAFNQLSNIPESVIWVLMALGIIGAILVVSLKMFKANQLITIILVGVAMGIFWKMGVWPIWVVVIYGFTMGAIVIWERKYQI